MASPLRLGVWVHLFILKTDKTAKGIASPTPRNNSSAVMSKQFGLCWITALILKELIERKQAGPRLLGSK